MMKFENWKCTRIMPICAYVLFVFHNIRRKANRQNQYDGYLPLWKQRREQDETSNKGASAFL